MVNKNLFKVYKQINFNLLYDTEKKSSKFMNTCAYILVNADVYNLTIFIVHHGLFICEYGLL